MPTRQRRLQQPVRTPQQLAALIETLPAHPPARHLLNDPEDLHHGFVGALILSAGISSYYEMACLLDTTEKEAKAFLLASQDALVSNPRYARFMDALLEIARTRAAAYLAMTRALGETAERAEVRRLIREGGTE